MLLYCALMQLSAALLVNCVGNVTQTTGFENLNITELYATPSGASTEDYSNFTVPPETTESNYTDTTLWKTATPETTSVVTTQSSPALEDATTDSTSVPRPTERAYGCPCDITPWLCDIGCCCDVIDCNIKDLSTVFNNCVTEESYVSCIESWLMFRSNIDPALVTVNESLFCVRSQADTLIQETNSASLQLPKLPDSYSFYQQDLQSSSPTSRTFYRVDDVLLTYHKSSLLLGVLRQPSAGTNMASCIDRNPAKFLHSLSLSCSRLVTQQSCLTDPSLSARAYFSDISLLKAPVPQNISLPGFTVPIIPLSEWPEPSIQNGSCLNVVSKVQYVLQYTSGGTVTKVNVDISLMNSDVDRQLLQHHAVSYQLASPSTPAPTVAVGLKSGAPVIGRFSETIQPLTVQGISQGGECSSSFQTRTSILFPRNYISGCAYRSSSLNCAELRSQLYGILRGVSVPDHVATNAGTMPNWTRVITQDCFTSPPEDSCESGCLVPVALSVQLLWAQRGLLSLPQNHILGAKYLFRCQTVKCPISSSLAVMTEVTFADGTVYPAPPRGRPQPKWKFPFGFFSQGTDEQDYGPVLNHCDCTVGLSLWTLFLIGVTLPMAVKPCAV